MAKSTFNVRKRRWDFFNQECKAASLRRDDLLNRVLPGEIELLSKIPPCDPAGQRWLKANWVTRWSNGDFELQPAAIALSPEVLRALNEACDQVLVPRDAFLDCALEFLSHRLLEAVIVIKNPRTTKDLVARMDDVIRQGQAEGVDENDSRQWIVEVANEWASGRHLAPLADDFYKQRLHWNADRLEEERSVQEMLAELAKL